MRVGRLTTRLLVGSGVVAGIVLLGAAAAHADLPTGGNPPPKRPVITGSPASPGTDSTPTWTFTDPEGQADTCHLMLGGVDVIARAPCSGSVTYDLSGLGYGTYTFVVENADAWSTDTYVRLPVAPTITSAPASPDNDTTPSWSFTLPAGTTAECTLLLGASTVAGPAPCTSPYTPTLSTDGAYTFRVIATGDGIDSTAATSTYTLDTTPPPAPSITGEPASFSQDDTPTWTFTTPADTATSRCTLDLAGTGTVVGPSTCTSPATFDLTALPDGDYTFSVVNLDAVGNASAADTSTYTLRRPPPAPVLTGAPAAIDDDATPAWTFTVAPGATASCTLSLGGATVAGPVDCTGGSQTFTVSAEGTYTLAVTASWDGLDSAAATSTYTYDVTPPPPATITPPPSPTNDTTPTVAFTLTGDATAADCSIQRGTTVIVARAGCTSPATFDLGGQPDGTYTLRVWAIDTAGNVAAPSLAAFVVDTTPPPAPIFTAEPTSPSTDETPTWRFTTTGGTVTRTCTLTLGATVISSGTCTSPATFNLTTQPVGTYTLTVTANDAAGNTGPPATSTYTLQRPPPAPVFTSTPTTPATDTSPTWTFTIAAGTTATCELRRGTTVVAAPGDCSSGSQTYLLGADGTYTIRVFSTDPATGLVSPVVTSTYTLDTTPPATPAFTATPGAAGNDPTPTWTFTTPATTAALECTLRRGTTVIQTTTCTGGTYTRDLTAQPDATYTLTVVAIDALGNRSAPATSTYTLDRVAPATPVLTAGPSGPTNDATPEWTFTSAPDATAFCSLTQGGLTVSPATACTGTASYDISARNDGTYTFRVTAVDAAGNSSPALTVVITLDRVAPAAPTITRSPTATSTDDTPEWRFTTGGGGVTAFCTITDGAGTAVVGPIACSSPAVFDLTTATDGLYTFSVFTRDPAGNASPTASSAYTLEAGRPAPPPPPPPPAPPTPPTSAPPGPTTTPNPTPTPDPVDDPNTTPTTRPGTRPGVPAPGGPTDPQPGPTTTTTVAEGPAPIPERIVEAVGRVVTEGSRRAAFPLLLLALVFLFLVIQNRIDRMDPKLAEAPVHAGDELSFGPPPSRRGKR